MHPILRFLALLNFFTLSACAFGPLATHETARTAGQDHHELVAGYGNVGYVLKWNYGLLENLDLGLQLETFSVGLRAKYAFINGREEGWSLAGALGVGESVGGSHYYGDVMGSYLTGEWEPYSVIRVVHVKTDPIEFNDKDTDLLDFTIDSYQYTYGQFFLGTRYWFTPHWLLSIEGGTLFAISSGLHIGDGFILSAGFGYRF